MQRNMDLVRMILMRIEGNPSGRAPDDLGIKGYSLEEIRYHAHIMMQEGLIEGTDVTKLLFTPGDTPRVTGVEARKISDGSTSRIEADLVVDCSGRSSRASEWMTSLGYPEIETEVVDAQAGYSTRR